MPVCGGYVHRRCSVSLWQVPCVEPAEVIAYVRECVTSVFSALSHARQSARSACQRHGADDATENRTMKATGIAFFRLAAVIFGLLHSGLSMADWPVSVTVKYEGKVKARGMNITGTGEWEWHNRETAYNTSLKLKAFFSTLRSQSSQGLLQPGQLIQPLSFVDEKRDSEATVFDYSKNELTLSNASRLPIKAGTLDRLSVLVGLGMDVKKNPQIGTKLSYMVAGGNKVQPWQFTIESRQKLTLRINDREREVTAYRVLKKEKDQRVVGFWYAPQVHVLPVRIELKKSDGDRGMFDMISLKPLDESGSQ